MSDYKPPATICTTMVLGQQLTDYPSINTADTQQVNNMEVGRINDSIESSGSNTDKTKGAPPEEPSLIPKAVVLSNHNSEDSPALSSDHSTSNMGGSPPPPLRPREASSAWRTPPTGEQQPGPEDALVTDMSEAECTNLRHEVKEVENKLDKAFEARKKANAELKAKDENRRTMKLTAIANFIKERQEMVVLLQNLLGKARAAAMPGTLIPSNPDQSRGFQWSEDFSNHSTDLLDEIEIQARKDYLTTRAQYLDHANLVEHLLSEADKKTMTIEDKGNAPEEASPLSSPENDLVTTTTPSKMLFREFKESNDHDMKKEIEACKKAKAEQLRTKKLADIAHFIKKRDKEFLDLQTNIDEANATIPGMLLPSLRAFKGVQWHKDFNDFSIDQLDKIEIQAQIDYWITRNQCLHHEKYVVSLIAEARKKVTASIVDVSAALARETARLPSVLHQDTSTTGVHNTPPLAAVDTDTPKPSLGGDNSSVDQTNRPTEEEPRDHRKITRPSSTTGVHNTPPPATVDTDIPKCSHDDSSVNQTNRPTTEEIRDHGGKVTRPSSTTGVHKTPPPATVDTDIPKCPHDDSSVNQTNRPTTEEIRDHGGKVTRPSSTTGVHNTAPAAAAAAAAVDTDIPKRSLGDDDSSDDQTSRPTAEEIPNHGKTATGFPDALKTDRLQDANTTGVHSPFVPPLSDNTFME